MRAESASIAGRTWKEASQKMVLPRLVGSSLWGDPSWKVAERVMEGAWMKVWARRGGGF